MSVAQHGNLGFTDMIDRNSRGYNYKEQKVEENWQLGQNFENQWDTVFSLEEKGKDVTFVNVTGWNEWVGMKFGNLDSKAVMVDNFYEQYTRDIGQDTLSGYHAPAADAEPEKIQVRTRGGDLFVEDENRARV